MPYFLVVIERFIGIMSPCKHLISTINTGIIRLVTSEFMDWHKINFKSDQEVQCYILELEHCFKRS